MEITVINTKHTKEKFPISTTGDSRVFEFETFNTDISKVGSILASNFILNYPLKLGPKGRSITRTARRCKEELNAFLADYTTYLILDFDRVYSEELRDEIKKVISTFSHVALPTRSCDEVTCFNFRAVMLVERFTLPECKRAVNTINEMLRCAGVNAQADISSVRSMQISAPARSSRVLWVSSGVVFCRDKLNAQSLSKPVVKYKEEIRDVVFAMFAELGFFPRSGMIDDKVNFHSSRCGDGFIWYKSSPFMLWHYDKQKNVNISKEFKKRHKLKNFIETVDLGEMTKRDAKNTSVVEHYEFNSEAIRLTDVREVMNSWRDNGGVFCVKSAMGTGKTLIAARALKMFKTVLIVTPRVSLAAEMAKRLRISLYTDNLEAEQMCCQYDSLHKLDISRFQCVIFDEFMTLESHIQNNCTAQFTVNNIAKINALCSNGAHVLIMDALLSQNVFDIFNDRRIYFCENTYRDSTPVFQHQTLGSFLKELSKSHSRRVTVSCVSKDKMLGIQNFLNSNGHKAVTICSDNSPQERETILDRFRSGEYTALVYTPSISVGISIDIEVDRHFHYDPGRVVAPVQSVQMMKRTRHPKQIDYFIGNAREPQSLSLDEIKISLMQEASPTAFCTFNPFGDVVLTPAGKMFAHFVQHDRIWRYDYRAAFDYLILTNFASVSFNLVTPGAKEFSETKLAKFKYVPSEWTSQMRDLIIRELGGFFDSCERYLKPSELPEFLAFNNLKRSLASTAWKRQSSARAAVRADFDFSAKLKKFEEVYNTITKYGYCSPKVIDKIPPAWVREMGVEKVKSVLGSKFKFRENFVKLYEDISKDELVNYRISGQPIAAPSNSIDVDDIVDLLP